MGGVRKTGKRNVDPLWYKDAVIYQLHVKSFFDGNNDGVGDFAGLTRKMAYLESLGVNAVWLLPFYPSPLRDDGYDIADYMDINPGYGTMADFKTFLDEAHRRGIRVITELVLNHTSEQHEWFRKSREAPPGSYWRNFYVWSNNSDRYQDARIIFKDFETSNWTWDSVAKAYFWHRFYSHQPDLNFENVNVHKALFKVIDFWLALGVDGMRLDAVPYLFEQEGTNCENLPRTFEFLRKLRSHVEKKFPDRMLLAEANQWPEDAVAYFGNDDMCHMAFHFPLMPRMFMALQMEDRFPIIDILEQTPSIPPKSQWAMFLRNHDELTLEMVSEEERDFMYRSYARDLSARINLGIRRRLAPLVQNSRRRIELLNILLFSLPGTPVVYYGDELGMGDNHFLGDRDGVRTPMQWSPDRNAGYSQVNPQRIFLPVIIDPEYHYQAINVETEEQNLSSQLWWMRRTIAMRRRLKAFSRGSMKFIKSSNASILSFVRQFNGEAVLVVVNLSRFSQSVGLGLERFAGMTPVDVFSGNRFPRIGNLSYPMTLGFHDYFWLELKPDAHADPQTAGYTLHNFGEVKRLIDIFDGATSKLIATEIMPEYLQQRTTAGIHKKKIRQTILIDRIPVRRESFSAVLLIVKVRYADGDNDFILLPLTVQPRELAATIIGEDKGLEFGLIETGDAGVIYDCSFHQEFVRIMYDMMRMKKTVRGRQGVCTAQTVLRGKKELSEAPPVTRIIKAGKRNTSIVLDEQIFFKLFRRIDEGPNPEIELHKKCDGEDSRIVPRYIGAVHYRSTENVLFDFGFFVEHFHHSRTLYHLAVDAVLRYFEIALTKGANSYWDRKRIIDNEIDEFAARDANDSTTVFKQKMVVVGELTAAMHRRLSGGKEEPFRVESFSSLYQRSLYQSLRGLAHRVFSRVEAKMDTGWGPGAMEMQSLDMRKKELLDFFMATLKSRLHAVRMRIHGDYHLGQIMVMDEQYRICDFEGLAALPMSERRLKRSPLRDIASMIHSLYHVAHHSLYHNVHLQERDRQLLLPRDQLWASMMGHTFIQSYFMAMKGSKLVTATPDESKELLRVYLLERALIELEHAISGTQEEIKVASRVLVYYMGPMKNLFPEVV